MLTKKKIIFTVIPCLTNEQQIGLLDLFLYLEAKNYTILVWTAGRNDLLSSYTHKFNESLVYKTPFKDRVRLIYLLLKFNHKWFYRFKKWANIDSFHVAKRGYLKKITDSFKIFIRIKPDYFFCWNQMCPHFGIANEVANKLNIETRTIEWGLIPNSFYFDREGSFGFSTLHKVTIAQINSFIYNEIGNNIYNQIKDQNLSIYAQKKEMLTFLEVNTKKIILVLGIDETDSNVYPNWSRDHKTHLPFHKNCLEVAIDFADQLKDFLVIYKPHPSRNLFKGISKKTDNLYVVNSEPNQLIELADKVVCFGSKMELNVILKGKTLLVFKGGLLANKGCALLIDKKKNLSSYIGNGKDLEINNIKRNFKSFLGYAYEHNLYVFLNFDDIKNNKINFINNFDSTFLN